ncbi:hypothetical protein GCM10020256_06950 [Streptomyces thermocoprophilus]
MVGGVGDQPVPGERGQFGRDVREADDTHGEDDGRTGELLAVVEEDPEAAAGPRVDPPHGDLLQLGHGALLEPQPVPDEFLEGHRVAFAAGCAALLRAEVLQPPSGDDSGDRGGEGRGLEVHTAGHVGTASRPWAARRPGTAHDGP